ncbi:hypothetical protein ACHAPJ_007964 [Fusarium lateritium]
MGYSDLDGSIMAYSGLLARKVGIAAAFRARAAKTLNDHPNTLESLLKHYSLDEALASTLNEDEAFLNVLKLINDVAFFMPAFEMASNFPKDAFLFSFNEPKPWDGLFKGHASHILDVAFLFQNFNQFLDETQRASAITFATDIVTFANGEAPWQPLNSSVSGSAFYSDGKREFLESPSAQQVGRNAFILEIGRDEAGPGMDVLKQLVTDFLAG